ncbi:uncharacterized protein LOC144146310 [Haemaphysalis longicornis]
MKCISNNQCGGGQQSPVALTTPATAEPPRLTLPTSLNTTTKYTVTDTGHAILIKVDDEEYQWTMADNETDPPTNYKLVQFHFHLGTDDQKGSEHTLDGKAYPLEAHLVHMDTQYATFKEAIRNRGGVAVLAALFAAGAESNPEDTLEPLVKKMTTPQETEGTELDLQKFFGGLEDPDYLSYSGSLTTPPCTEGVKWFVFKQKATVKTETLLLKLRMGQDLKIDLLTAIQMLKGAWDDVKQETIANCFKHARFVVGAEESSEEDETSEDFEEPALEETLSEFSRFVGAVSESMTINDFVGDDETGTAAELTDGEIAAKVTCELTSEAVDGEPGPSTTEDPAPLPTAGEAVAAVELLRRYSGGMEGGDTFLRNQDMAGASKWATMKCISNNQCGGRHQSPVALTTPATAEPPRLTLPTSLNTTTKYTVTDTGHAILIKVDDEDYQWTVADNETDPPTNYKLVQFHFHLGTDDHTGSEHTLDGKAYPLEVHLVHMDARYATFKEAIRNRGGVAVLAALFAAGAESNPEDALEPLVKKLTTPQETEGTELDLEKFFGGLEDPDYLSYTGSLTTPPCTEGVKWFVFKQKAIVKTETVATHFSATKTWPQKRVFDFPEGPL